MCTLTLEILCKGSNVQDSMTDISLSLIVSLKFNHRFLLFTFFVRYGSQIE